MPTLILLRHGRSSANTAGVLAGWTPEVALDEHGRAQARGVAQRLSDAAVPLALVASSPLERCQETASLAAPGTTVRTHEQLGECRYGAWTGRPIKELLKEPLWEVIQKTPSRAVFPDSDDFEAESISDMAARAVAAVRELDEHVAQEHGKNAVWMAVSHGDVIKAVLADALGTPLDEFQRIVVDPGSVSIVRYSSGRPMVLRVNDGGGDLSMLRPPDPAEGGAAGSGSGSASGSASGPGTGSGGGDDEVPEGHGVIGGGAGASTRVGP